MSTEIEWTHLRKVLEEFAEYFIELAKKNMSTNRSFASGTLADTMSYKIEIEPNRFAVYIELESYWEYLENGRRAGKQPPVWKIYEWIKDKGIHPKPLEEDAAVKSLAFAIRRNIYNTKHFKPPVKVLEEWIKKKRIPVNRTPSVMSLAWAISKHIAKNGTKAYPFFEPAKKDAIRHYENAIADAIREDIETYLEKQLEGLHNIFK